MRSKIINATALIAVVLLALCSSAYGQIKSKSERAITALEEIFSPANSKLRPIFPPGYIESLQDTAQGLQRNSSMQSFSIDPGEGGGPSPSSGPTPPPAMVPEHTYQAVFLGPFFTKVINSQGYIVGTSLTNSDRPYIYSNGIWHMVTNFNISTDFVSPYKMNSSGQIVGTYNSAFNGRGFVYMGGQVQTLHPALDYTLASGINDNGLVVGFSVGNNGSVHQGFFWDGSYHFFSSLVFGNISPTAVNAHNQIVGYATVSGIGQQAFIYSNGKMTNLGSLGALTTATDINDHGQIVGVSGGHLFLYYAGTMQDLGPLGTSFHQIQINNNSEIMLMCNLNTNILKSYVYSNGKLTDLESVTTLPQGWRLDQVWDINDSGQIVGVAYHTNSRTYQGILLNPLPGGRRIETNLQPQTVYSGFPDQQSGKSNLVLITHGRIPAGDDPTTSTAWVHQMSNVVQRYISSNNLTGWQVATFFWTNEAYTTKLETINGKLLNNAGHQGKLLGDHLTNWSWSYIHLIGHSAGANLIQDASMSLRSAFPLCEIQNTFLDPYVGVLGHKRHAYGSVANWSDNYFTLDSETLGYIAPFTSALLDHSYNVDVTRINSTEHIGVNVSGNGVVTFPCQQAVDSHGSAIDFYFRSITNPLLSFDNLGFYSSKEGGGWNNAITTFTNGNHPAHLLGFAELSCVSYASGGNATPTIVKLANSAHIESATGARTYQDNGSSVETGSPSWYLIPVDISNVVNYLSFDAKFLSTNGAEGLYSIYWDDGVIGSIDERGVLPGWQHYVFDFPQVTSNTTHALGFRLDAFTGIKSILAMTNLLIGSSGPSEPFTLSFTTNLVDGLRVQELTGPAGWNYSVQTSSNLLNWSTIVILVNTNGKVQFVDPSATNQFEQRFYRAFVR